MRLADRLIAHAAKRPPDFVIGGWDNPYLLRWWLMPWREWQERAKASPKWWMRAAARVVGMIPQVYLHNFRRSDDDRALHDHPWLFNASVLLRGYYWEHTPDAPAAGHLRGPGDFVWRWLGAPHRVQLAEPGDALAEHEVWTVFIVGPKVREWGFHCPRGWVHWRDFTAPDDKGGIGKGCDQ